MATDVLLDDHDGTWITLKAGAINAVTTDIFLDHPGRRSAGGGRHRRALVHNASDGLTINYNGDYPGGVRINQVVLNLRNTVIDGEEIRLPRAATIGDLVFLQNAIPAVFVGGVLVRDSGASNSIWLCVGKSPTGIAEWQQLSLGETIYGSE